MNKYCYEISLICIYPNYSLQFFHILYYLYLDKGPQLGGQLSLQSPPSSEMLWITASSLLQLILIIGFNMAKLNKRACHIVT